MQKLREMKGSILGMVCGLGFIVYGCAFNVLQLPSKPAELSLQPDVQKSFVMEESVEVDPACGYKRTLRLGTRWDFVGRIPEGEVYKPRDQVLTVECSHVHEAYLVVSDSVLKGYFLPVDKAFVASPDIKLRVK